MRIHAALLLAPVALIWGQSTLPAQPSPLAEVAPPITWCKHPAPNPKWERQTAHFLLGFEKSDASEAQRVLTPFVSHLLGGMARAYVAAVQPSRDHAPGAPRGEPRYHPADLVDAEIRFDLWGDGTVGTIVMPDSNRSALVEDMAAALVAAAAAGDGFGPYADSSVRTRFRLLAALEESPRFARWPAFTMYLPVSKPVVASGRNHVGGYPEEMLGWEGKLTFRYMVDEKGRALPETATIPGSDEIVWESKASQLAFESFKKQVITAMPRMRFYPAEEHGCLVRAMVWQSFEFRMR